jgi:hypothetical protein
MRYPAEIYTRSPRPYNGLPDLEYPFHDRTVTVTRCGRICLGPQKIMQKSLTSVGWWLQTKRGPNVSVLPGDPCRHCAPETFYMSKLRAGQRRGRAPHLDSHAIEPNWRSMVLFWTGNLERPPSGPP